MQSATCQELLWLHKKESKPNRPARRIEMATKLICQPTISHVGYEQRILSIFPFLIHSVMHEAIPFLPFPMALVCLFLNIVLPGSGTILSGIAALCMGQPRVNIKEGRKLVTLLVNLLVGISQFFTITFLFVGWFWSIAWGGLIIIHASQ